LSHGSLGRPIPLAGFFCNGELGPVGECNFVHGYTASLALFTSREASPVRTANA
jgi:small ligand-binding sensory domain FIST